MGNCFGLFSSDVDLLANTDADESTDESEGTHAFDVPIYHPHPGLSIPATRLTEEEQIQIVKRIDMLQILPTSSYVPTNRDKLKECSICMCDLNINDEVRYLPCLHTYHRQCIDDWLMRSFTCPSCLRPVEVDLMNPTVRPSANTQPPPEHEDLLISTEPPDEVTDTPRDNPPVNQREDRAACVIDVSHAARALQMNELDELHQTES